jgi:hypothetical protein
MLQWLMDTAEGAEQKPAALAQRLLILNFAAIHTSSMVRLLHYSDQRFFPRSKYTPPVIHDECVSTSIASGIRTGPSRGNRNRCRRRRVVEVVSSKDAQGRQLHQRVSAFARIQRLYVIF